VLAVSSNDGNLFAVLSKGVKLVRVGSLNLFASDVGQLCLGDERLGLGANQLLLENNNLGGIGLLVLELRNLVGDLLLAWRGLVGVGRGQSFVGSLLTVAAGLDRSLNVTDTLDGNAVLIVSVNILILELANLVHQNAELVGNVRDVFVSGFAPDGQLLL
jgi:hypothetical protein